jgi:hypothetical protein
MSASSKTLIFQTSSGDLRVASPSIEYLITKETANFMLPVFEFKLARPDRTLIQAIVDKNPVQIYAIDESGVTTAALGYIVEYGHDPLDSEKIVVRGTYSLLDFVNTQRDAIYTGNSVDVIAALTSVQTLNGVIDESGGSNDSMSWVQGGRSDRNMVLDLWLHSQLSTANATLLGGINWAGELRMVATPTKSSVPVWSFSTVEPPSNVKGTPLKVENTHRKFSAIGNIHGTSSSVSGMNPATGEFASSTSQVSSVMTRGALDTSSASIGFQYLADPDNFHSTYASAYYANLQQLMQLQRYSIEVHAKEAKANVKLLDYAEYFDKIDDPQANPNIGAYVVTEVRKVYTTTMTDRFFIISRENVAYS